MGKTDGEIYYIADGRLPDSKKTHYIKIGFTTMGAEIRLKMLQTGNPQTLFLLHTEIGDMVLEKEIHKLCSEYRVRGEWFFFNEEVAAFLSKGIRDRRFARLDSQKEQLWIDERAKIEEIRKYFKDERDRIQEMSSGDMYYLTSIHPRFDICPKHKVYYNSCGCK